MEEMRMKRTLTALSCFCVCMLLAAADQPAGAKEETKPANLIRNGNFQEWSAIAEKKQSHSKPSRQSDTDLLECRV